MWYPCMVDPAQSMLLFICTPCPFLSCFYVYDDATMAAWDAGSRRRFAHVQSCLHDCCITVLVDRKSNDPLACFESFAALGPRCPVGKVRQSFQLLKDETSLLLMVQNDSPCCSDGLPRSETGWLPQGNIWHWVRFKSNSLYGRVRRH